MRKEESTLLTAKNNKGEIIEYKFFTDCWCECDNLIEIISIPNDVFGLVCSNNQLTSLPKDLPNSLEFLSCNNNNIKQLPDLRKCCNLTHIWCDICCFEDYMLEMNNTEFQFFC